MKLYGVLVICLTNIILRATATYVPVVLVYNDDHSSLFLFAGFLSFLLLSLRKRKPLTAATTSTTSTTTISQPGCSNGYTLYTGPGRSFCFRYPSDCKTWDEARTACQMERADLASLDDESLQPFSEDLRRQFPADNCETPTAVWLGARTDSRRLAIYIDGQSITSNSPLWASGEPNTPGQCILSGFDSDKSFLLDSPCNSSAKYVCQQL